MYPSIDIDFSVEKCVQLIRESDVEFLNVNFDELGLFLAITDDKCNLSRNGLQEFCPTRDKVGRPPTITSAAKKSCKERWKGWTKANQIPSCKTQIRTMVTEAVGVSLKTLLKNHIFKFNNKLYQQNEGGAIGVGIAGDVANLFMVWWDKQLKEKLANNNIIPLLYSRYVDDIDLVVKPIPQENEDEKDKAMMNKIKEIANTIHPNIKVTVDYPSAHHNRRLPVLDTEQWIEEVNVDGIIKPQILHSHYIKPMSNRQLIHKDSALSDSGKMNILVAELVRVMRNVSRMCQPQELKKHIQYFIHRMQYSSYSQNVRVKIYKKAKQKYDNIVKNHLNGSCPMYRNKLWNKEQRNTEKRTKKNSWYGKNTEAVMFIDATPNSKLAIKCQEILTDMNLKIKVVEKSGRSIKSLLCKSYPFDRIPCQNNCKLCEINPDINCKLRGVIYRIRCLEDRCIIVPENYEGETSRSIGERVGEHLRKYNEKDPKSILYQHAKEKHNGVLPNINVEIISICRSDPMLRQVTESVCIRENNPTLNTKSEWGNSNVSQKRR